MISGEKMYYFANDEYVDYIYGSGELVCIDFAEVKRLASEWEMTIEELMEQMHEATAEEITQYGIYDSIYKSELMG